MAGCAQWPCISSCSAFSVDSRCPQCQEQAQGQCNITWLKISQTMGDSMSGKNNSCSFKFILIIMRCNVFLLCEYLLKLCGIKHFVKFVSSLRLLSPLCQWNGTLLVPSWFPPGRLQRGVSMETRQRQRTVPQPKIYSVWTGRCFEVLQQARCECFLSQSLFFLNLYLICWSHRYNCLC